MEMNQNISLDASQTASETGAIDLMRSIAVDLNCRLPSMELAKLYRGIEHATPEHTNRVVQFVSAYKGEGTGLIAFELATIAATLVGKRVLFIDTAPEQQQGAARELASALIVPLDALLRYRRPLNDVLVGAAGTNLFYAALSTGGKQSGAAGQFQRDRKLAHQPASLLRPDRGSLRFPAGRCLWHRFR